MHAMIFRKYAPAGDFSQLKLEEVKTPAPGPDEVLVKVKAAAINDWELGLLTGTPLFMRLFLGLFRPRAKVRIIGCDMSGSVESVGAGVKRFKPGQKVYSDLSDSGFGAFAEYVCVPEKSLHFMPSNLSFAQAAAIPHAGMLALQALRDIGGIQQEQSLLINGAGGGVGILVLQYAKLFKCRVTAVDNAAKQEYLHLLGFDRCINYEEEDFTRSGRQYDLILDVKTTRQPTDYLRALKPGGSYVTVGGDSGLVMKIMRQGKRLAKKHGKTLRVLGLKPNQGLKEFTGMIESGKILPAIDKRYPLKEVPNALQRFYESKQEGKIIINVEESTVIPAGGE
jgi:NADPH:quinone reductase-like Zn-dependent oxidoreductase